MSEQNAVLTDAPEIRLFDPTDTEARANPYPVLRTLREMGAVRRSVFGVTLVAGYDPANALLRDPRFSSDMRHATTLPLLDADDMQVRLERRSKVMLFADPPLHTRLRTLVAKAFTPRVVSDLRPRIEALTARLLDEALERETVDLVSALAYPLPLTVIAEMLGVATEDHAIFEGWSRDLAANLDPFQAPEAQARALRSGEEFRDYFRPLIAARRERPREDLLSRLATVEESGDSLDEEEVLSLCTLLLVAGHETTVNLIANGVLALMRHPAELQRLRDEPALVANAVEELLRYEGVVQLTARVATEDVEVGGLPLAAGDIALVLIGAANRDPARFPDPDTLDVGRRDVKHLGFGGGIHFCLGAPLARLEAQIAIGELVRRADLSEAGAPEWRTSITLRGLASLPVRLERRAGVTGRRRDE